MGLDSMYPMSLSACGRGTCNYDLCQEVCLSWWCLPLNCLKLPKENVLMSFRRSDSCNVSCPLLSCGREGDLRI